MKLYIIDQGLWHLCPDRKKIDSLFYRRENYFYYPICSTKIPDWLGMPFLHHNPSHLHAYSGLAKKARTVDYELEDLKNLKYQEIEIEDEDLFI